MQFPPSAGGAPAFDVEVIPSGVRDRVRALPSPVSAYLYDPAIAAAQAQRLRTVVPSWVDVFYAVKANSFPPVVDALAREVDGFEVASTVELAQAAAAATAAGRPLRAVSSGPGKTVPLLRALIDAQVEAINVESRLELERVAALGQERGGPVPVLLRVNPASVAVSGTLAMGGGSTPFGVPEDEVADVLAVARRLPGVEVIGFHLHAVSGNTDALAHAAYVDWCLRWSGAAAAAAGLDLRVVDVGGGLGVAFDRGPVFDHEAFGGALGDLTPPGGCQVVLEPGRWLVAGCGWYVAEVVDLKRSRGSWYAVVRGGINHFLLPASWDLVHPFAVLPLDGGWPAGIERPVVSDDAVTVVGELCTPEDVLARDVHVDHLRAGDVVVFPRAGSYGWEFALHHFLQHPRAPRLTVSVRHP